MVRLMEAQRQNAIGRLQAGATQQAVANHFGVTRQTISNLWHRHNATGNIRDRPRSGRPRVTSAVQDRYIRLRHLRDRTLAASATTTAIPGLRRISDQTVRNRLRKADLLPED
jgi:transposase